MRRVSVLVGVFGAERLVLVVHRWTIPSPSLSQGGGLIV